MISPQEPSRGGMSNEEYARVMPGEKYWREHIAKEIEAGFCNGANGCYGVNKEHCDILKECADIARGKK